MVEKRIEDFDLQNPFWESHWDYSKHPELFNEPPSEAAKKAAEVFKKEGITKILELGGGLGRDTLFFARIGFKVYVLEYTEAGVQTIKNKANQEGLTENITAIRHDVRNPLPFAEGFFDSAYSHMLYCMAFTDEELEFLSSEINRVLKPNGINLYTVRNVNDPLYGTGVHKGRDIYEVQGFILHFFNEGKIIQLTKGYELIEIKEFEEGTLPKRLYQVVLRKNNGGIRMSEKIVVDVRDKDDYEKEHIPGAKSIPVSELEQRISELDKDTEIQIVCNRGGLKSSKAAEILKEKGFNNVGIIEGGMESWKNKR